MRSAPIACPGFGKEIDPNEVLISCEKPGYKQVRVFRRTAPDADPKVADRDRMHDAAGVTRPA